MALIGKIRKNFWFVLILLGLALAAFLIMDTSMSANRGGQVASAPIGSINGQKINYNDFLRTEQGYYRTSNVDQFTKKRTIWDYYVEKSLLSGVTESMGLAVSRDELMDLQFGPTPSPIITQNQWDAATLNNIRTTFENGEEINPDFEAYWAEQENQIINESLKAKLNGIISKSVYTPSWLAEESFSSENTKVDFKYVKIPFDQIDGAGITVSDADIKNYVSERRDEFEQDEETRIVDYAIFDVVPTKADSNLWMEKANELKSNFANAESDSLFVTANKGIYTHLYRKLSEVPVAAQGAIAGMNPGETFGPFINNGTYTVLKLMDKKVIPDSVSAQHILKSANPAIPGSFDQAEAFIDSIQRVYNRGGISFDTLAFRHTEDPGSKNNGGLYESFPQTQMVPEFTKACFVYGETGKTYKVRTSYGVHLIKVGKKVYNDRDQDYLFASVSQAITPSEETQNAKYDEVTELIGKNRDAEALQAAGVTLTSSAPIKANDFSISGIGSGDQPRNIIKWAFDVSTELGDVANDVYRFTDPVQYYYNKYVVATLKSIQPAGMPSADVLRNQVEAAVINQKKGESLVSSLTVNSLDDLASQYNTTVETATDVTATRAFVPGVGNEPDVIGSAFDLAPTVLSKPIVGSTGVFVLEGVRKMDAGAPTNLPFLKTTLSTSTKSQVAFKILENMKKRAKIVDNRSEFF